MLAALLTALLFSVSAICGHRTSRQIGGVEANFWRVCLATIFLAIWAYSFGTGFEGDAFPIFVLSGLAGIGLGDSGFFQALPRLGSRLTVLLTQCLTALFAVVIEWFWLKTRLTGTELLCIAVILVGVAVALAPSWRRNSRQADLPDDHLKITPRQMLVGFLYSIVAALGGAPGRGVEPQGLLHCACGRTTSRPRHDRLSARRGRRHCARHSFVDCEMALGSCAWWRA
jgi:drug/metabolite transporter (DMT)-like permease